MAAQEFDGSNLQGDRDRGKSAFVLFDTGSLRSYVRRELASGIRWKAIPFSSPWGEMLRDDETCVLECSTDGLKFDMEPTRLTTGEERGRRIDAIIGALTVEKWGLIPNPKTGEIDLTMLRKREFTEYCTGNLSSLRAKVRVVSGAPEGFSRGPP
ncbi:MAG: hypothetical protein QXR87_04580 [Candidatus Hadarchaeales archaeon]